MNPVAPCHCEERSDKAISTSPHPSTPPSLPPLIGEGRGEVGGSEGGVFDALAAIWQTARRIAFLGVGSPLRADDSVGLYLVAEFEQALPASPHRELRFYLGESAPENFTGVIREFAPTHLIICDAAKMDASPGTFAIIEPEKIGGVSFTTHTLPLKILVDYFIATTGCQVTIIGVQPKSLDFAHPLSPEVKAAADRFVHDLKKRLS